MVMLKNNAGLKVMIFCLFCLLVSPVSQQIRAQSEPPKKDIYFQLVEKLRKGDKDVNFGELRRAFVNWLNTLPDSYKFPDRSEMIKAFEAEDHAKAVKLAEEIIDYEFINAGVLGAMADAYKKIDNKEKAALYEDLSHRARHGLFLSGDGKTPETAYYVMSIPEEYRVMRELGYTVSMQSLSSINGQAYDVLSGKDSKGNSVNVYFNICSFFGCKARK